MAMVRRTSTPSSSAAPKTAPSIWEVMNYPVPRGKCVHKPSLLTASCPCLRFMLNPLQASTTFACDGCGHHASFHNLRNLGDEGDIADIELEEQRRRAYHEREEQTPNGVRKAVAGRKVPAITNGTNGAKRKREEEEKVVPRANGTAKEKEAWEREIVDLFDDEEGEDVAVNGSAKRRAALGRKGVRN